MLAGAFSVQSVVQLGRRFKRRKTLFWTIIIVQCRVPSNFSFYLRVRYHPPPTFLLLRLDLVASDFALARPRCFGRPSVPPLGQPSAPSLRRRAWAARGGAASAAAALWDDLRPWRHFDHRPRRPPARLDRGFGFPLHSSSAPRGFGFRAARPGFGFCGTTVMVVLARVPRPASVWAGSVI